MGHRAVIGGMGLHVQTGETDRHARTAEMGLHVQTVVRPCAVALRLPAANPRHVRCE